MSGRFGDEAEYRHDRPGQNPRLPPREPCDYLAPGSEPLLRLARAAVRFLLGVGHRAGRVQRHVRSWRKQTPSNSGVPSRLSAEAKPQHLPLGKALQEYSGARNRERLLSLLMPVQLARR